MNLKKYFIYNVIAYITHSNPIHYTKGNEKYFKNINDNLFYYCFKIIQNKNVIYYGIRYFLNTE